jgi:hypothetical protein
MRAEIATHLPILERVLPAPFRTATNAIEVLDQDF